MANITVTLFWNMDDRRWTSDLLGTTEMEPIQGLVQGDIVKFAVRFVQGGVAVALTAPVFTASGIKAQNDFVGSYLIQLSAPVLSDTTLYTFTVTPLNSAQLNTFLQTYRNTWCALEIYDSANGILTTPLELQITPGYSLSGTPTDNQPGVVSVAAGKTVTFPLSLTFPSAAGTNGFQLTTDGAGTLTWAASGGIADGDKGDITVSASGATWTIDAGVVTLAKMADMATARIIGRTTAGTGVPELLTISGTGSVAMTTSPSFTTPSLGAATATSINGIAMESLVVGPASATADAIVVYDGTTGRLVKNSVVTVDSDGFITTTGNVIANFCYGTQGFELGGGSLGLNFLDANELNNIKIAAPAGLFGSDKTQTLQNATGTVALTSDITGGTLAGSFRSATNAGVPLIAKSFTTADGSTGDIQQWQKSDGTVVARIYGSTASPTAGSIFAGGMTFGNTNEFWQQSTNGAETLYFNYRGYNALQAQFRSVVIADGKGATIASFTGSTKAVSLAGTLAVTGATTLTGLLTANGGIVFPTSSAGLASGTWWDNAGVLTKVP